MRNSSGSDVASARGAFAVPCRQLEPVQKRTSTPFWYEVPDCSITRGTPGGAVGAVLECGVAAFDDRDCCVPSTAVWCPEHDAAVSMTPHNAASASRDRMAQE